MTLEINNVQPLLSNKNIDNLNNDLEDGEIEDELSDVECKESKVWQSDSLQVRSVETDNSQCHLTFPSENDVSENRTKKTQVNLESYNCIPSLNAVNSMECSSSHEITDESQVNVNKSVSKYRCTNKTCTERTGSIRCKENKLDVIDTKVNTCLCQESKRKRYKESVENFERHASKKHNMPSENKSDFHRTGPTEEELEDDEMIFVRGASPVLRNDFDDRFMDPPSVIMHMRTGSSANRSEMATEREGNHRRPRPKRSEDSRSRSSAKRKKAAVSRSWSFKKRHRKRHKKEKETQSNRKMKLCKFYLLDTCTKKPTCQYMHSEFPCKFFHTGLKCFAGERCKFSHGVLTEELKTLLLKHLETAPKEFLGDFPRLSRDGVAKMISTRADKKGHELTKTIPSLLEIRVPTPPEFLMNNRCMNNEVFSTAHDMPDPDIQVVGSLTPMPGSPKFDAVDLNESYYREQPSTIGNKKRLNTGNLMEIDKLCVALENNNSNVGFSSSKFMKINRPTNGEIKPEQQIKSATDVPLNLPKKQRELFLRIQQQQREALNSEPGDILENSTKQELSNESTIKEENWYSSDDEDENLANILKNLSNNQSTKVPDRMLHLGMQSSISGTDTSVGLQSPALSNMSSQNALSESVGKLLSTIASNIGLATTSTSRPTNSEPNVLSRPTCIRDPRLAQRNSIMSTSFQNPLSQPDTKIENNPSSLHRSPVGVDLSFPLFHFKTEINDYSTQLSLSNLGSEDVDLRRESGKTLACHCQPKGPCPCGVSTFFNPENYQEASLKRDVDLREIMGLPFSPVPIHKPATEIDASITSHPPIPYKLYPITIPTPNYIKLKSYNTADPKLLTDPRLRKLFNFKNESADHTVKSLCLPMTSELKSYKQNLFHYN